MALRSALLAIPKVPSVHAPSVPTAPLRAVFPAASRFTSATAPLGTRALCADAAQPTLSQINRHRANVYLQRHLPHPHPHPHPHLHPQPSTPHPIEKKIPPVSGCPPSPAALKTLLETEHAALDVVLIDVREKATFADSFLVCSAHTPAHIRAIAHQLIHFINAANVTVGGHSPSICGHHDDEWLIVDIGHTIVHIMTQQARDQYRLEHLWMPHTPPPLPQ